jgi:hypothetical protein
MKRSVRIAAKAHSIALLIVLLSASSLAIVAVIHAVSPSMTDAIGDGGTGILVAALVIGFVVILSSALHIAVSDALLRMERREKSSDHDL